MKFIEEQVESILTQQHVLIHIFISVDLSSDLTYEWCKQLENVNQNITVLNYGERFGGAAKNFYHLLKEVNFTNFSYVSFADQDDIWFLDKLSHGIKQMELVKAEAYSANVISFWENRQEKLIDKSQSQKELDYLFEAAGPGCTYIFTNKAASLIKSYLNTYPELNDFVLHDWLSYSILRHNHYVWFIDSEPKMKYRQHEDNQVGANASLEGMIYRMNYILSGQVFDSIKLLVSILGIPSMDLSSRIGILRLTLKVNQLRRRPIDRIVAFIALVLYAIKGPK